MRKKAILLHNQNLSVTDIFRRFKEARISVSRQALYNLIDKFCARKSVADVPRGRTQRVVTDAMKSFMEEALSKDDELTATKLRELLLASWPDLRVRGPSLSTIKRARKDMGWVCTRPHYCQTIRQVSFLIVYKGSCQGSDTFGLDSAVTHQPLQIDFLFYLFYLCINGFTAQHAKLMVC